MSFWIIIFDLDDMKHDELKIMIQNDIDYQTEFPIKYSAQEWSKKVSKNPNPSFLEHTDDISNWKVFEYVRMT